MSKRGDRKNTIVPLYGQGFALLAGIWVDLKGGPRGGGWGALIAEPLEHLTRRRKGLILPSLQVILREKGPGVIFLGYARPPMKPTTERTVGTWSASPQSCVVVESAD